jgi:hypothetical protein
MLSLKFLLLGYRNITKELIKAKTCGQVAPCVVLSFGIKLDGLVFEIV